MLGLAIVAMSVVRCQERRDPVVEQGVEIGTVVEATLLEETNLVHGRIALASGDTLEMMFSAPAPIPGARLPLRFSLRESGTREYAVDEQLRLTGGH